jgi:hypothetical protein
MKNSLKIIFIIAALFFYEIAIAQNPTPTIAYGNDWVATDAIGRTLPDYGTVGGSRDQRYIGMFYWLWHPYIRLKDGPQKTTTQLVQENPNSPAFECNDSYWGEPENGFYHPEDPWSTRRNLQMLANAGVDFIYIDFTNGSQGCDALNSFMPVVLEMYNSGIPVPKIVFFLNEGGVNDAVNCIMDKVYNNPAYQPLWFYWQGKPLIMADQAKTCSLSARACTDQVKNFFTWRTTWAFGANQWNFLDNYPQQYYSFNGVAEQMPVSKAMGAPINDCSQGSSHLTGSALPSYDQYWETPLTEQGLRFDQNWSRAHQIDPQIVCVSGWNELVAAAWPSRADNSNVSFMGKQWNDPSWRCVNNASCISKDANGNHIPHGWYFVDEFNTEFNRDIEPMKGGYTDSYYYQLIANVRKHKGLAAPQATSSPKTIAVDGQFGEWGSVTPVQKDAQGDCQHRNFKDVKNYQNLTNNSGRNDIIESRTTADGANVYFYIKTASAITPYTDPNWMMVYLNTDKNKSTGWEGLDYAINMGVTSATQTTIKKRDGNGWTTLGTASYSVSGNEMEISVPRALVGLNGNTASYYYQIFDNPSVLDNIEDNFINGESAPDRRFNYSVTIASSFSANKNFWHFDTDIEGWNTFNSLTSSVSNSIATMNITGGDPYMYSPNNLNISTSDYKYIVVSMQNMTTDNSAELFWVTNADGGFDGVKHVKFTTTPNDTKQQYYIIDLSANPNWMGNIKQIRLDPSENATTGAVKIDFIKFVGTYTAALQLIPGKIEIENFDNGGQGNAYFDTDILNNGGEYRLTESVDIQTTTDVGGGYNVGWTATGEWMEYLVNVQQSGNYAITLRAAAVNAANVHIEMDGIQIGNSFSIPITPTYQTFEDVVITGTLVQGMHILRVYEETGGINLNNIVFVKQNELPTVSITAPANNANYTAPASVSITAIANDSDGSISKVEFYNGTTLLGTDATTPFVYNWTNVAVGNYSITAKAYDNTNAMTMSTAIAIQVNAPANKLPTVSITAPSNSAIYTAPASVSITANANDADGTISKVEFYNGTTLLGTDATTPFTYNWTSVAVGNYNIIAKAYDNTNAMTMSTAIAIQVNAPANQLPVVSLTAPTNNAVYTSPASISITANASDADGTISKVEFYSGATLLGTDATTPFTYTWTNVTAGSYSITAKAYDNTNSAATSNAITIQVNAPANQLPIISITAPSNNASYTAPASVSISANANDADGTISKVEFYNGTTLLNSDATAPYSYNWTNVAVGTYNITAKAYDNVNALTTSTAIAIQVNAPANQLPTVSITSPANSATFTAPANVTITANANDADGSISKVEFYNGTSLLGSATMAPYSYLWTNVSGGDYTITAKAYDNTNSATTSASNSIHVNATVNQSPTVSVTVSSNKTVAPANVTIIANASDDGQIKKVEFYNGTTLLATVSNAPYTYTWNNIGEGTYSITAKVYDDANVSTTSNPVSFSVDPAVPTSLTNAANALGLIVAPSPFQSTTKISIRGTEKIQSIVIYNTSGIQVGHLVDLDSSELVVGDDLADGMYLVQVTTSAGMATMKVVKGK